jgi:hypothetical protein
VVVSGPDATSFLQSLLSQDLAAVAVGESVHSLLLEPKGKLVVDLRAAHLAAEKWWCTCEAGFGSVLADGLKRFRIRVKVEIDDRSAGVGALALRGPEANALLESAIDTAEIVVVRVDWPDAPGAELFVESSVEPIVDRLVDAGAMAVDGAEYESMRVEAGIPRQGYDIDETTIAQEAFLERDAVSFTKGCFLGQELVCRIDSRGHVNRLLRRLRADAEIERGSTVTADGKEVGTVTTAAGHAALAMLRRTVEPGSTVVVGAGNGQVTARVEAVAG